MILLNKNESIEIEDFFLTKKKVSDTIELMVKDESLPYMDAVIEYCERNEIEYEIVAKLISKAIKESIREEAQNLHLMKKVFRGKLPIY